MYVATIKEKRGHQFQNDKGDWNYPEGRFKGQKGK